MKLRSKILGLAGILLMLTGINSGIALWKLDRIGAEIADIAEADIPLTRHVTDVTVAQLEQGIRFERALRLAFEVQRYPAARAHYEETLAQFASYGATASEQIAAARTLAERAVETAQSAAQRDEFTKVAAQLETIAAHHSAFELHAEELLARALNSAESALADGIAQMESEQQKLDHEMEGLLAEIGAFTDAAARQAEADEQRAVVLLAVVTAAGLVFGVGFGWTMSSALAGPLRRAVATVQALAAGDTSVKLEVSTRDEVGELAQTIEVFRQTTIKANELAEQQKAEEAREKQRLERQAELTRNFDDKIGGVVETVTLAATELHSTAESLSSTAAQTTTQSGAVAGASQEASTNVQMVASAAEELANSISEISNQVAKSNAVARDAESQAEEANCEMQQLDEAAQRIGAIIQLISDIAEQTNLLALNATIEAARAGEAGKGFAVVASEVKSLATQTARATEEISQQIGDMQSATGGAVGKIKAVNGTIARISEITTGIASAVEEQTAATQEIARNVEQAAAGTAEVDKNITGVSEAAAETGHASKEVMEAAKQLSEQAEIMKAEVQGFLDGIRALDRQRAA